MNFDFSDEQKQLRDTARKFLAEKCPPKAVRAVIDHAFGELRHDTLAAGARVSNPASRRVLEKCGFQWTGVRLTRIRAINSAAPIDRFRLDRKLWLSLKGWGAARRVA